MIDISSGDGNWNDVDGNMSLNLRSCAPAYSNLNWCDGESETVDKYLGIRFEFSGAIHYGWIRLEVGANPTNWRITD